VNIIWSPLALERVQEADIQVQFVQARLRVSGVKSLHHSVTQGKATFQQPIVKLVVDTV